MAINTIKSNNMFRLPKFFNKKVNTRYCSNKQIVKDLAPEIIVFGTPLAVSSISLVYFGNKISKDVIEAKTPLDICINGAAIVSVIITSLLLGLLWPASAIVGSCFFIKKVTH